MNNPIQPIKSEQFKALLKEEKELYGEEVTEMYDDNPGYEEWTKTTNPDRDRRNGYTIRTVHYPKPEASQKEYTMNDFNNAIIKKYGLDGSENISADAFSILPEVEQQKYDKVFYINTGYGVKEPIRWVLSDEKTYNRHNYSYRKIDFRPKASQQPVVKDEGDNEQWETVEQAATKMWQSASNGVDLNGEIKYILGAKFGANWQSQQQQSTILSLQAEIERLRGALQAITSSFDLNVESAYAHSSFIEAKEILNNQQL